MPNTQHSALFLSQSRVVFIDGDNLECGWKKNAPHGTRLDWLLFADFLRQLGMVKQIKIYLPDLTPRELESAFDRRERERKWEGFIRFLGYLDFEVVIRTSSPVYEKGVVVAYKSSCDAAITTDMVLLAGTRRPDGIVLVSGDRDFAYPLNAIRTYFQLHTTVVSFHNITSGELRGACNKFISLDEHISELIREADHAPPRVWAPPPPPPPPTQQPSEPLQEVLP